jgi:hypothetical protein
MGQRKYVAIIKPNGVSVECTSFGSALQEVTVGDSLELRVYQLNERGEEILNDVRTTTIGMKGCAKQATMTDYYIAYDQII